MANIATIAYGCELENFSLIKGIDIIEKIAPKLKGHMFHIFGNRTKMISENQNVKYVGFLNHEKLIGELKKFDFYFQPSRSESFGVAVLEAMSLGVTPIVSNRGALPEIVQDCGIIFDFSMEKALEVLKDPIKIEKQKLMKRAEYFSYERRKNEILKIVSNLLE